MEKLKELKTFEDACKVEGLDAEKVINADLSAFPEQDREPMRALSKLMIIARAANRLANDDKEWQPNWDDSDEEKYYPWFDMRGGSSGFRFHVFVPWYSFSYVGSRLCFISYEVAEYVAEQFREIYAQFMVINKNS